MDIVIVGHVDHGKSTIVGRLLTDTDSLPRGKLEAVKANCERHSKPFEYAFLLDALKDEQSQGITIDAARIFFKTPKRTYTIIDAPGHIEFLKNMVTGASRAEAALLVIDAKEGIQENSRRHGYMLSMLGVRQVAVLVNKMDLIGYRQREFEKVQADFNRFLKEISVSPVGFIPVAGFHGENIVQKSKAMVWYRGPSVIEMLDSFASEAAPADKPFRMPVQDVYKFTRGGDDRRIVAGTVESGTLKVGQDVIFYPSGKKSRVKTIESFNRKSPTSAMAKDAVGFTLAEQIYVGRGEVATVASEPRPQVSTLLKVSLFWLGKEPMIQRKSYALKLGTARVEATLDRVTRLMNTSTLATTEGADRVECNSVAECTLRLDRAIAFDLAADLPGIGRFVIVDNYDIRGGGLVRESVEDRQSGLRDKVMLRNTKWEMSRISDQARAERYRQRAALVLITGDHAQERKGIAKSLEESLFASGRIVYFLGMGNSLYGVSADIKGKQGADDEALRRFAEIVNLLLDAGLIVIATAAELTQENLEIIKTSVPTEKIETIWVGETVTTNISYDFKTGTDHEAEAVAAIKTRLQDRGLILKSC